MERLHDKIEEIGSYLSELELVFPNSLDEYLENLEKRLASERAFEKIIESVNDLAILFLKYRRFEFPNEDIKAFDIIANNKVIPENLAFNLRQAMGMRNFLAHQYDKVDNEIVFNAINENLFGDVEDFLEFIKKDVVN